MPAVAEGPRPLKRRIWKARLALLSVAILFSSPASAQARQQDERTPAEAPSPPFAASSYLNRPLRADAPIDPRSAAYVTEFRRQVRDYGPWINSDKHSTPVYTVKRNQPTVRVKLDTSYPPLDQAWREVPLPRRARAAKGSDRHLVVWQPSTSSMWEFWLLNKRADGWHARLGAKMTHVSRNPGYFDILDPPSPGDAGSGATASGIPLLAGLIRGSDVGPAGIQHALAVALPEARPNEWVWPAHRTDGYYWTKGVPRVPEGARFRLDPALDIERLDISPAAKLMARALQRYGLVVRDKSAAVTFYAEDPLTGGEALNRVLYGSGTSQWPSHYLREDYGGFPWQHLQLLKMGRPVDWSVYG